MPMPNLFEIVCPFYCVHVSSYVLHIMNCNQLTEGTSRVAVPAQSGRHHLQRRELSVISSLHHMQTSLTSFPWRAEINGEERKVHTIIDVVGCILCFWMR